MPVSQTCRIVASAAMPILRIARASVTPLMRLATAQPATRLSAISAFLLLAAGQSPPPPEKPPAEPPPVIRSVTPPVAVPRPLPPGPVVEGPRARANLASYVAAGDYPDEARFNAEQGTVGVALYVGADGRVAQCVVRSPAARRASTKPPVRSFEAAPDSGRRGIRTATRSRTGFADLTWRLADSPAARRARPVRPLQFVPALEDFPERAPAAARSTAPPPSSSPSGRTGGSRTARCAVAARRPRSTRPPAG